MSDSPWLKALGEPDKKLDEIWTGEAERRLDAYREGKLEGVLMGKVSIQRQISIGGVKFNKAIPNFS